MNKIFAVLIMSLCFLGSAHAASAWTEVLSTTLMSQAQDYKDILIHNPGTYSQIRVQVLGGKARIDRVDTISHVLWGRQVDGLAGVYTSDTPREASFSPRQVRWVRIYASSMPLGMPIPIRIWMR